MASLLRSSVSTRASVARPSSRLAVAGPARRIALRRSPVLRVNAQQQEMNDAPIAMEAGVPVTTEPVAAAAMPVQETTFLGSVQEAINGRAAMLGFVAAVVSESLTHQGVWSQIAGLYVDTEVVEKPIGQATLLYFAVISIVTVASIMPKMIENEGVDSRSFGPFTPSLEKLLGRAAMMGFAGWLLVEKVFGFHFL